MAKILNFSLMKGINHPSARLDHFVLRLFSSFLLFRFFCLRIECNLATLQNQKLLLPIFFRFQFFDVKLLFTMLVAKIIGFHRENYFNCDSIDRSRCR